eukprot:jgi/Bigna1/52311/estExt_Genewise1Plus.C_70045
MPCRSHLGTTTSHNRRILEESNEELANYPPDLFSENERSNGAIILHTIGIVYMFAALALVCDEFFVPTLEVISSRLDLQDDVAGATFMAAGGSAPELATSFVGTFVSRSDVGFGTIVGSAVFNILFVIGACAMAAKTDLKLTAWPLARDSVCYAISLGVLIAFFNDREIEVWEAAIMLSLYLLYVVLMYYNREMEIWVKGFLGIQMEDQAEKAESTQEVEMKKMPDRVDEENGTLAEKEDVNEVAPLLSNAISRSETKKRKEMQEMRDRNMDEEAQDDDDDDDPMSLEWPSSKGKQVSYVLLAPLTYSLYYTIPDVRREGRRDYYIAAFLASVGWIAVFSYFMVWWATSLSIALRIPSQITGLTILAIGTSVPDLLESIIVTREGRGDMAISSSLGSNIFDVTIGLPLPWFLFTLINGSSIEVGTNGLLISLVLLFAMLFCVIGSISMLGWKLSKPLGFLFFFLWVIFVTISIVVEALG